jgi:hypothetical protein
MPKNPIKQKDINDRFYTKPEIAKQCVQKTLEVTHQSDYTLWIEPSAGNKSFVLPEHSKNVYLDIKPEHPDVLEQDWLTYPIPHPYPGIVVIGNPPFGKRNDLSRKFIEHALSSEHVFVIAFILPEVYKKYTLQQVFPPMWRLKLEWDLPPNSFLFEGKDYHIPAVFQVWIKTFFGKDLRVTKDETCDDFEFTTKDDADFFVFGSAPHNVIPMVKPTNRGYYIKSNIDVKELMNRFKTYDWKGYSSVNGGVYWLTKSEVVKKYNEQSPS